MLVMLRSGARVGSSVLTLRYCGLGTMGGGGPQTIHGLQSRKHAVRRFAEHPGQSS